MIYSFNILILCLLLIVLFYFIYSFVFVYVWALGRSIYDVTLVQVDKKHVTTTRRLIQQQQL